MSSTRIHNIVVESYISNLKHVLLCYFRKFQDYFVRANTSMLFSQNFHLQRSNYLEVSARLLGLELFGCCRGADSDTLE